MKSTFRIILGVASVVAMVALVAPVSEAQCSAPQQFGSTGLAKLGMVQVEIAGALTGTEIGRFWDANNSAFGNNFGGNCPAGGDWLRSRNSGNRGVQGAISAGTCIASTCPSNLTEMIYLIEDYGSNGPPGVGDTASFSGFRMDATPPAARYWNFARSVGDVAQVLPWLEYPLADVQTSTRVVDDVMTVQNYVDVGLNFQGANAGGEIPDAASIISFDVCSFHGAGDPGRDRVAWDSCTPIPYTGGPSNGNGVTVLCPGTVNDTYVAIGATFAGGGAPVASELVGRATAIECNPNLADPEQDPRPRIRPKKSRRTGR